MRADGYDRADCPINGEDRLRAGATVFFENEDGEQRAVSYSRVSAQVGLARAITEMEGWDGVWHVACISSPATIWLDLHGRETLDRRGGHHGESRLLQQVGRSDLWHGGVRSDARR